jgi:hypothetical protein
VLPVTLAATARLLGEHTPGGGELAQDVAAALRDPAARVPAHATTALRKRVLALRAYRELSSP